MNLCAILGQESLPLVSGDLLGEPLLIWETLENFLFVLQYLTPLPPDFTHPLLERQWQTDRPHSDSEDKRTPSPHGEADLRSFERSASGGLRSPRSEEDPATPQQDQSSSLVAASGPEAELRAEGLEGGTSEDDA